MEKNILLLAEVNLSYLAKLNLQMYQQILMAISSQDGSISIPAAKQLLAIQSQYNLNIELTVNAPSVQQQGVFWAWKLGELAVSAPDTQITILTEDQELQVLAEICTEQGQSVQVLQIYSSAEEAPAKTAELQLQPAAPQVKPAELQLEPAAPQAKTAEPETQTEEPQPDSQAIAADKKDEKGTNSVANMIAEKEERQRKNEQIINTLMKKASTMPYQITEGKPVSALKEQEVGKEQQIQLG